MGSNHEKNGGRKSRDTLPLKAALALAPPKKGISWRKKTFNLVNLKLNLGLNTTENGPALQY